MRSCKNICSWTSSCHGDWSTLAVLNASGLERTASRHRNEAFWPVKCYSAVMEGMVSVIGGGRQPAWRWTLKMKDTLDMNMHKAGKLASQESIRWVVSKAFCLHKAPAMWWQLPPQQYDLVMVTTHNIMVRWARIQANPSKRAAKQPPIKWTWTWPNCIISFQQPPIESILAHCAKVNSMLSCWKFIKHYFLITISRHISHKWSSLCSHLTHTSSHIFHTHINITLRTSHLTK